MTARAPQWGWLEEEATRGGTRRRVRAYALNRATYEPRHAPLAFSVPGDLRDTPADRALRRNFGPDLDE